MSAAGHPGTYSGLALRLAQFAFAAAAIVVMASASGFANFTAFCYLIAAMGLQALWSCGLACLDAYALIINYNLHNPVILSLVLVGNWVTAVLSFAAASSATGVIILFERDVNFCRRFPQLPCGLFELASALCFVSWVLIAISSHIMFWLVASMGNNL